MGRKSSKTGRAILAGAILTGCMPPAVMAQTPSYARFNVTAFPAQNRILVEIASTRLALSADGAREFLERGQLRFRISRNGPLLEVPFSDFMSDTSQVLSRLPMRYGGLGSVNVTSSVAFTRIDSTTVELEVNDGASTRYIRIPVEEAVRFGTLLDSALTELEQHETATPPRDVRT